MKKRLFFIVFFIASLFNAQNLTRQEMLEFYPNDIGNNWSYWWVYYDFMNDYYERKRDEVCIVKDTVVNENSYRYVEFLYGGFSNDDYLERVDTTTGDVFRIDFYYDMEFRVDNIYAQVGDTISILENRYLLYCDKLTVLSMRDTILNGYQTTIREIAGMPGNKKLFFARGIGLLGAGPDYWIDTAKVNGMVFYDISSDITDVRDDGEQMPEDFVLYQNYPNPFSKGIDGSATTIKYSIPVGDANFASPTRVVLKVYDALGREITTLVNENQFPGEYTVEFNAEGLTNGVYFYKLQSGNFSETKKLIFLK